MFLFGEMSIAGCGPDGIESNLRDPERDTVHQTEA